MLWTSGPVCCFLSFLFQIGVVIAVTLFSLGHCGVMACWGDYHSGPSLQDLENTCNSEVKECKSPGDLELSKYVSL